MVVTSWPSGPYIAFNTNAQSSTERQMGPILSMVQLKPMAPYRLTLPYVGRRPVTPHRELGLTMEPSVSVPIENPTRPPAVTEAEPAEDPLDPVLMSHGLLVVPANHTSPCASAPIDNFARSTAPALKRRSMQVALYVGI